MEYCYYTSIIMYAHDCIVIKDERKRNLVNRLRYKNERSIFFRFYCILYSINILKRFHSYGLRPPNSSSVSLQIPMGVFFDASDNSIIYSEYYEPYIYKVNLNGTGHTILADTGSHSLNPSRQTQVVTV